MRLFTGMNQVLREQINDMRAEKQLFNDIFARMGGELTRFTRESADTEQRIQVRLPCPYHSLLLALITHVVRDCCMCSGVAWESRTYSQRV
jgi:hypothetical protein